MTLFIASLFLPQTLGFVKQDAPESDQDLVSKGSQLRSPPSSIPNLLSSFASRSPSTSITRQDTPLLSSPPAATPPMLSRLMSSTGSELTQQTSSDDGIGLLSARLTRVKIETATGKTKHNLTIPQSRASSPPSATLIAPRPSNMRTTSMTRPADYIPGEGKKKENLRRKSQASINPAYSRAQYQTFDQDKGNGGLRNAVNAAVAANKIAKPLWVGLIGIPSDEIADSMKRRIHEDFENTPNINSLVVDVSDDTARLGYDHYCKRMLWPIFHYQIPDSPKTKIYEEQSYKYYEQLNQAFADRISSRYKRGDTIWINDYHLLLAPKMIRQRHPQAMIGLFLHIAFPSSEVFRCLEKRKQILDGMLASNLIGFQTADHCQHFKQTCSRLLYVETTDMGIQREHSFVNIIALPIGIDPGQLANDINVLGVKQLADTLSSRYQENGMKVIIGRDKLDHVKGVLHKVRAFGEFLRTNPDQQGRVVLIQFGSNAKQDHLLMAEIRDIVSKINSRYSIIALDYQPILLKPDVSYQEYLALITMADLFIVSSVREGMNLTCHEYVYCQQDRKNPLILSEFVGSAQLFQEGALIVNPFDYKKTAEAIQSALSMTLEEKTERWALLNGIVHKEDGGHWAEVFVGQIQRGYVDQMKKRSVDLPRLEPELFAQRFAHASRRLLLIDYEGTLLHWELNVGVIAGTGKIVDLLNVLTADTRNTVFITSERTPSELERTFRRVQNLGLIAENGGYIRSEKDGIWSNLTEPSSLKWKDSVREIVQYYKERTPGTFIEEQNNRIVFHYASAENMETAQRQVSEMHNHIMDSSAAQDVHALPLKNALVIEPSSITKASAAEVLLSHFSDINDIKLLACFGNDRSDEELFAWANGFSKRVKNQQDLLVLTVNVGIRNTEARMYVNSTFGVHGALNAWTAAAQAEDTRGTIQDLASTS